MNRQATVSTIVVTYNSQAVLLADPGAVPKAEWVDNVFVDNASGDNTVEAILTLYPAASVIRNTENLGFSAAVNLGSQRISSDYILLLNPDASVSLETLRGLVQLMESNSLIAISAPFVQDSGQEFSTIAGGMSPTVWRMFTHATGLSRLGSKFPLLRGHYLFAKDLIRPRLYDVDWVSGGCMLIRASAWIEHNGLTDRWFMYAEDIEFCMRIRASGLRIVVDSASFAGHEVGKSSSNVDGRMNPAWILNLYDLYKWRIAKSKAASFTWKLIVASGFGARVLVYQMKGISQSSDDTRKSNVDRFRIYRDALWKAPL